MPEYRFSERQRRLLGQSIRVWERKVRAQTPREVDLGQASCPLCQAYDPFDKDLDCRSCPIALHTGHGGCRHTPYANASAAHLKWMQLPTSPSRRDNFRGIACRMIYFMKRIRDKEK